MAAAALGNALLPTLLGAVAAPALFGAGLVRLLGRAPRDGWREFAAWSYLVGHFALAVLVAAWFALRPPLPFACLPALAAAVGAWLLWRHRRAPAATSTLAPAPPRADPWLAAATALAVLLVLDRTSLAALQPILETDEANIWSAKAKLLFVDGGFARWAATGYAQHLDYPLWNPLQQVLAFACSDRVLLWENRLPVQGFAVALVLMASAALERCGRRWLAIVLLLALVTSRFLSFAGMAYADVMVAFAALATAHALTTFAATGDRAAWRLANVALAALLASKNEGALLAIALAGALGAAWFVARQAPLPRLGRAGLWLVLPLATLAAGLAWNHAHGLANDLTAVVAGRGLFARIVHFLPERLVPVVAHFGELARDASATRWLLLAALLAPFVAGRRALLASRSWPALAVALTTGGYMLVFLGTPHDHGGGDGPARGLAWHLATAADRTLLHVLPLAAFATAVLLAPPSPTDRVTAR